MGDLFSRANKKSSSLTSQWAQPENTKKLFGHGRRFPGLWEKPKDNAKHSNRGSRLVGSGSVLHSDSPNKSQEKADADAVLSGRQAPESAVNEKTDGKGQVPPIVGEALKGPGQALDTQTRSFMEAKFGHDFSQVRLYSGDEAERAAKALKARAFTYGSKIVFGRGYYDPESTTGKKLLAHELAHTVQQEGLDVTPLQAKEAQVSQPGDTGERQADQAAEQVVQGKKVNTVLSDMKNLVSRFLIQRQPTVESTPAPIPTPTPVASSAGVTQFSQKLLDFLEKREGFVPYVYDDSKKADVQTHLPPRWKKGDPIGGTLTVGIGHTKNIEKYLETGISRPEAVQLLKEELQPYSDAVHTNAKVPLSQNEFDALTSFAFNEGAGYLGHVAPKDLKTEDKTKVIPKNMMNYTKVINKKTHKLEKSNGLVSRRKAEVEMFENGTY